MLESAAARNDVETMYLGIAHRAVAEEELVLRMPEEFAAAWTRLQGPGSRIPFVDFSRGVLVGIVCGGYEVFLTFDGWRREDDTLVVEIHLRLPVHPRGEGPAMVTPLGALFGRVPHHPGPVRFERRTDRADFPPPPPEDLRYVSVLDRHRSRDVTRSAFALVDDCEASGPVVIRDREALAQLWSGLAVTEPPPAVDFEREMLVAMVNRGTPRFPRSRFDRYRVHEGELYVGVSNETLNRFFDDPPGDPACTVEIGRIPRFGGPIHFLDRHHVVP